MVPNVYDLYRFNKDLHFFTQFRKRKRGLAKAKAYGVEAVPTVAINWKLVSTSGINTDVLKASGLCLC
ncbi:hypothetical protein DFO70_1552 [Cytobacillus firmus]|uniref:Thioredoxin-like fold domain-containing protein n=2 Tax=Cytobacillus TaxID=2675230 RepID=A0A366JE00_CYTFI|nr:MULTISPECIES: hypothetical protein [Bacillaceae]MCM3032586.1 hypothetical protein [Niallia sp. MER 6]PGT83471.1 hypothetical protein COD11_12735 [Bacillus sp. AFS040349]RBP84515.1 hypothetical protein DFO70_1552 [Cytobacillus firmus]TDX34548.1 hypothetical protein DFO72_1412 [Cytobacillus oceanisediminis]